MPGFRSRSSNATPVWLADDDGNPISGGGGGGVVTGSQTAGTADNGDGVVKVGGIAYSFTLPTYAANQRVPLSLNLRGALFTTITDGGGNPAEIAGANSDAMAGKVGIATIPYNYVFNGTSWDRQPGSTAGSFMVSKGSAGIATSQVSVGTAAGGTQIVAARAGRGSVKITNLGTTDVFIGVNGVSSNTGDLLPGTKGASIVIPTSAAIFGIAGTAQTVSVMEVF